MHIYSTSKAAFLVLPRSAFHLAPVVRKPDNFIHQKVIIQCIQSILFDAFGEIFAQANDSYTSTFVVHKNAYRGYYMPTRGYEFYLLGFNIELNTRR